MPKFAVLLHARPVMLLDEKGGQTSGGVYCWRAVETNEMPAAVDLAREKLLADEVFMDEVWNQADDPPRVEVEEVAELEESTDLEDADSGCVFYYDDEDAVPYGAGSEDQG